MTADRPHRDPPWAFPTAAAVVILAILLAYRGSYDGPFLFDDVLSIPLNPTLRDLHDLRQVLSPPGYGFTVQGRPLLNLTLAVNVALGGLDVQGFHVVNVALHALAALTLMALVRRTLQTPRLSSELGAVATPLAAAVAVLWAVHPLQTESVTYIVQRAESLAGWLILATLYLAVRAASSPRAGWWSAGATAACLLAMASKETAAGAPLLVAVHDRLFSYPSWRAAWRARWPLYAALASTWALLAWLVIAGDSRSGTAGFGVTVSPLDYLATQAWAVGHYLRLCAWPSPLVLDYGAELQRDWGAILPGGLVVGALLAWSTRALLRAAPAAFLGAAFFVQLAPPSSVVPVVTQVAAEHRMYVPSAAVVTAAVLVSYLAWRRLRTSRPGRRAHPWLVPGLAGVTLATAPGAATTSRNAQYRSAEAIWRDTTVHRPDNVRGRYSYGSILADLGDMTRAVTEDEAAVRLRPESSEAHGHLGAVLVRAGRLSEGLMHLRRAVALKPGNADAQHDLGLALDRAGRVDEAMAAWEAALQAWPALPGPHRNLGVRLLERGRVDEAVEHLAAEVWLSPDSAEAHGMLAYALSKAGRLDDAIVEGRAAVRLAPGSARWRYDLALVQALLGRMDEAGRGFAEALEQNPTFGDAECGLGTALAAQGKTADAVPHWERGLALGAASDLCRKGLERARGVSRDESR